MRFFSLGWYQDSFLILTYNPKNLFLSIITESKGPVIDDLRNKSRANEFKPENLDFSFLVMKVCSIVLQLAVYLEVFRTYHIIRKWLHCWQLSRFPEVGTRFFFFFH
jgi:hypothetical protein